MGGTCCGASSTASKPDIICSPSDSITLNRPIRYATYGPEKHRIPHDITNALRGLHASGLTTVSSVEEAVGNPFPGQQSIVRVWFLSEKPDAVFNEEEEVKLKGFVCYATFNPKDVPPYDVTETIKSLQKKGRTSWENSTAVLGNNFPGQTGKDLKIWFNNNGV